MQEDTQKRMVRYLNDALAVETGGLVALQDIGSRSTDFEIKQTMENLSVVTTSQIERLTRRIHENGGSVSAQKGVFNSALAKGHRIQNAFHDQADKETQDVIKAYTASYGEVGMYTSMVAYARAIGDTQTAQLAETLIQEERRAGELLQPLISRLAVVPAFTQMSQPTTSGDSGGKSGMGGWVLPAVLLSGAALTVWALRNKQDGGSAYPSDLSYSTTPDYSTSRFGESSTAMDTASTFRTPTAADLDNDDSTIEIVDVIVVDRVDVEEASRKNAPFTTSSGGTTGFSSTL